MVPRMIATAIPIRTLVEDFFIFIKALNPTIRVAGTRVNCLMVMEITSVLVKWIGSEAEAGPILIEIGPKGANGALFDYSKASIDALDSPFVVRLSLVEGGHQGRR